MLFLRHFLSRSRLLGRVGVERVHPRYVNRRHGNHVRRRLLAGRGRFSLDRKESGAVARGHRDQTHSRPTPGARLVPSPNSTCRLAFEVPVSSSTAASSATTPVVARALSRYTRNNRAIGTSLRARTSDTRKRCWLHPDSDHATQQHQTGVPRERCAPQSAPINAASSCSRKLAKASSSSGATTTTLARMVRRRGKRRRVWANRVPKRRAGTARVPVEHFRTAEVSTDIPGGPTGRALTARPHMEAPGRAK